ncbi:MAG: RagB/SusD family nutrient uptake outer membrane protein [Chitinophagaceae bacterium]|nr:RagB/SusD family nutrient uptake outer membrane protein [Chitinophagaceae bacterium]
MKRYFIILALTAGSLASCKKDYTNPNAPTDAQVFSNTDGLTKVVVGIKQRWAVNGVGVSSLYQAISAAGLSTGELTVLNAGNADLAQLQNGGTNLAPNNGVLNSFWTTANIVNAEATKVINSVGNIPDVSYRNAVQAYAHLYKALAIGTMAQFWERVPVNTGENATYNTRLEALAAATKLLDDAAALIGTTPLPAAFLSQVGNEIDVRNTLLALAARFYLMAGNNDLAIARANAVNLTVRSIYFYNTLNPNPVFRSSLITNNVYGIVNNFGLSGALAPDPADRRIAFHLTKNASNGSGFFRDDATAIPIYQPGEMLLIQAEAHARRNDLPAAINFLNQVLTKTTDAFGVGAGLPAYSGAQTQVAVLQEVYKNRCIELYMSGLKLEDSRRFGRPGPGQTGAERTRNFYPYPQQERDGNPNTPADPAN